MPAPLRFEAGTQPVSQAVGLGEAVAFLSEVGTVSYTHLDVYKRQES